MEISESSIPWIYISVVVYVKFFTHTMPSQKSLGKRRQSTLPSQSGTPVPSQSGPSVSSQSGPVTPYWLGGLYAAHWPTWDVNSKRANIVSKLKYITEVRYRTGDFATAHQAFPLYITEPAGGSTSTTTRIYIPKRYKPILRLLNAKMAWHILCLTFGAPRKSKNTLPLDYRVSMRRYQVWIDGARRNIIYCDSIRESFFRWIEEVHYGKQDARGIIPKPPKMDSSKRCNMIENWMMHELFVKAHVRHEIRLWVKENRRRWDKIQDVFDLGWYSFLYYIH